jgi:hypothetical protein
MPVEHKTSKGVVYYVNTPEELAAEAAEEAAAFAVAVADWRNQGEAWAYTRSHFSSI